MATNIYVCQNHKHNINLYKKQNILNILAALAKKEKIESIFKEVEIYFQILKTVNFEKISGSDPKLKPI